MKNCFLLSKVELFQSSKICIALSSCTDFFPITYLSRNCARKERIHSCDKISNLHRKGLQIKMIFLELEFFFILFAHLAHPWSRYSTESSQEVGLYARRRLKYKHTGRSQQVHRNLMIQNQNHKSEQGEVIVFQRWSEKAKI